mgnify:FL=1
MGTSALTGGHYMEKVISLLSEIEEKASKIIESASTEKENLHNQLKKELEQLDEQITSETNKKLDKIKDEISQSLKEEEKKLADDCDSQIKHLEETYQNEHGEITDKIFHNIIGV